MSGRQHGLQARHVLVGAGPVYDAPARLAMEGRHLGHYEILALVGSGGMGVVYRARDNRLHRQVAVKVLLPDVAKCPDALARFEREARAVAAISHPNILTIHDFGTADGSAFAVMEFLEGQTLRVMLERGPIPTRKAVSLAVQIAHGLAAAHDRNFVHRDLKPENIGLTRTGDVKILDFGLAREPLVRRLLPSDDTVEQPEAGLVLGTVGYMSPEQVRGDDVDYRSDLFAFGAVLYEMLTARRAFGRATTAESLTAILNDDPPELQHSGVKVPPALERVIRRCLEKHPQDRFHSARDLAFALDNALVQSSGEVPLVDARTRRRFGVPAGLVAAGLTIGAGTTALWPGPADSPYSVTIFTSSGTDSEPAASPSGDRVAYESSRGGQSTIWLRELSPGGQRALIEKDLHLPGAHRPRFFADGKRLLYVATDDTGLGAAWEVHFNADSPTQLVTNVTDAEPSPVIDEEIGFVRLEHSAAGRSAMLGVLNTRTGQFEELLKEANVDYTTVRWAPDGQRVATIRRSSLSPTDNAIVVVDRRSGRTQEIRPEGRGLFGAIAWNGDGRDLIATESPDAQVFVPGTPGRILGINTESKAQRLLFEQGNLFGLFGSADANATIDVAGDGGLVFSTIEIHQTLRECLLAGSGCGDGRRQDRRGAGTTGYANDRQPAYSPDGQFVIFSSNRSGDLDLWVQSTRDGSIAKLTQDKANDWDPVFAPDGRSILWSSDRETGHLEIWAADFDAARRDDVTTHGLTRVRRLTNDGQDAENPSMVRGGEWIIYASYNANHPGIWRIGADGSTATPLASSALSYIPDVSPNGQYAAYLVTDNVNQRNTIRVVDIPAGRDTGFRITVPYRRQFASGNVMWGRVRWAPDSQSLLFIGQEADGQAAVFTQRFVPGTDTTSTRRRVITSLPGAMTESLAISPDGRFITVSDGYYIRKLALARDVGGVVGRQPR